MHRGDVRGTRYDRDDGVEAKVAMYGRTGQDEKAPRAQLRLADVPLGQEVELESMELPESDMRALLERGVLPGCRLCPVRRSPFGDPIVHVDGTVLALRRELAACLCVRRLDGEARRPLWR